jgi:hypothetical protein
LTDAESWLGVQGVIVNGTGPSASINELEEDWRDECSVEQ